MGMRKGQTNSGQFKKTHGLTKTRAYSVWRSMKERCSNTNHKKYHLYGGRGISVCERWMRFENFLSDMGQPPLGLTLERLDNAKGYSPENCKWADYSTQNKNRSKSAYRGREVTITAFGKTMSITEWAVEIGIKRATLSYRKKKGWPDELIIKIPLIKNGPKFKSIIESGIIE